MHRLTARTSTLAAGLLVALTIAGTAYAHVDVSAEPAVAGASNVVVTLRAEAESAAAGIGSVRVVLPAGIAAGEVTLADAPTGWTLTRAADGYTVGGPALSAGQDAVHSITVARLPDATRLVFRVLVNYADGTVDRWIEEPTAANPDPDNPAAVLELQPAPRPTAPTSPPAATPTPAGVASGTTAAAGPPTLDSDGGGSWLWWLIAAALLVVAALVLVTLRRRRGSAVDAA